MSSSISQVWNAELLFTRLVSPLPPQTRQFGKCDFSSPRAVRAAGTVVAPNLWMWHIDWEIYSLQTTLVFPVDSPQVSALSSHRSHSSSRTMCENIWEEKKKIVFEKCVFLRVRRCFYLIFLVGQHICGCVLWDLVCVCRCKDKQEDQEFIWKVAW